MPFHRDILPMHAPDAMRICAIFENVRDNLRTPPPNLVRGSVDWLERFGAASDEYPDLNFNIRDQEQLLEYFKKFNVRQMGIHFYIKNTGFNINIVLSRKDNVNSAVLEFYYQANRAIAPNAPIRIRPIERKPFREWHVRSFEALNASL